MDIVEIPIGIVDGLETVEVRDAETNELIGYNQTIPTEVME